MIDAFEQAARAETEQERGRRQLAMRTGLRIHAAVFVLIQLLLVAVWASTGAGFPWFVFPLLGWGAGLAAHFYAVRGSRALGGARGTAS